MTRMLFCLLILLLSFLSIVRAEDQIPMGAVLHLTGDQAMQGAAFREGITIRIEDGGFTRVE